MNLRDFKIGRRPGTGFGIILSANFLNYRNKAQLVTGIELSNARNLQASAMKSAMLETGIALRDIGLQADVSLMQKEENKVKQQRKLYGSAGTAGVRAGAHGQTGAGGADPARGQTRGSDGGDWEEF